METTITASLIRCSQLVVPAFVLSIIYTVLLALYRLFLHPLRKFPGPKAAATTYWYEFYYDVFHKGGGQYFKKVKEMHQVYGPIVRVSPNEVHIDDPSWYNTYCGKGPGQVREKYAPAAKMAGTSLGVFATANHAKHRQRRSAISHFFSKQSMRTIEPMLRSKIEMLCDTLLYQASQHEAGAVELRSAFLAFGTDVICDFALGTSPHGELLLNVERQKKWRNTVYSLEDMTPIGKQFSWCLEYAKLIPVWLLKSLWPDLGRLMQLHKSMRKVAGDMISRTRDEETGSKAAKNVFEAVLHSTLPRSEKSQERLADEGFELIVAGGETVARNASAAIFNLLNDAHVREKILVEMEQVSAQGIEKVTLQELEKLPWLTAVVKETLRLQSVISSRLPLVSPHQEVMYEKWIIPSGTPFSMSPIDLLHNPLCFDDPLSFKPERWMLADSQTSHAQKYFVPFSRGARSCLGINLAYSELYLLIANMLVRFDMELYNTTREADMCHARDCFVGKPVKSSQGVQVKLRPKR